MKKLILYIAVLFAACSSPTPGKFNALSLATNTLVPGFVTKANTSYDATTWNITGTVTLSSGVKWKGGHFTGKGAAFTSQGNCVNVSIDSVLLDSSLSTLFDGNVKPFVTYNGNDSSFLYKNIAATHILISGKTMLYAGTYEGPKTFHNVCFGLTIKNVVKTYDASSENILVVGHSIYKFRGYDWTLKGNTKTGLVDNGILQINSGNAQLKNIYSLGKKDGYGGMRCWGVALGSDTDQDVKVENCVDAETVVYGTMDFRIDPGYLQSAAAIPLKGCDAYFTNNTSANKEDINNGYVTSACVIGATVDDLGNMKTVYVKNCLAYGAHVSAMANNSSLIKDNSSGKAKIVPVNNIDIPPGQPVPPGVVDSDYYGLTGIGAIRPGVVVTPVKQRSVLYPTFDGKTWHYFYDDGSIQ